MDLRRLTPLIEPVQFERWLRITPVRHLNPIGVTPGDSRFCLKDWDFGVLYLARRFDTAFVETIIRNNFDRSMKRQLPGDAMSALRIVTVSTRKDIFALDLTGDGAVRYGVPNAVIRSANHASGRAFARQLHEHLNYVDAILYPSRYVDGGLCIAIFERALEKLTVVSSEPLETDPYLDETLSRYRIKVIY